MDFLKKATKFSVGLRLRLCRQSERLVTDVHAVILDPSRLFGISGVGKVAETAQLQRLTQIYHEAVRERCWLRLVARASRAPFSASFTRDATRSNSNKTSLVCDTNLSLCASF